MDEPTTDETSRPRARMTVETIQGPVEVEGEVLGHASSENPRHSHGGRMPRPGMRCSACRWMQVTILRDGAEYIVVNQGLTRVDGETDRGRVERTTSAIWVIECLHRDDRLGQGRYVPAVSRKALAEAASVDEELAAQFVARVG